MRIGVSSTGRWWVSMGPLGWLIVSAWYLASLIIGGVIWLLVQIVRGLVRGSAWVIRKGWRGTSGIIRNRQPH